MRENTLLRGRQRGSHTELSEYLRCHRTCTEYRYAAPFVSYGLTSLISLFIGMGLVMNVGLQSSAYNKELKKKEIDKKEEYL